MAALEIERKYVLPLPDLSHPELADARRYAIEQVYLTDEDGWVRRVRRMRALDGSGERFYSTRKRAISALVREEDERDISPEEYAARLTEADVVRRPLRKTRLVFEHGGHKWELDLFERYPTLAILEVELAAEDEAATPPPFLGPVREVTGAADYLAVNLALKDSPPAVRAHERRG